MFRKRYERDNIKLHDISNGYSIKWNSVFSCLKVRKIPIKLHNLAFKLVDESTNMLVIPKLAADKNPVTETNV